MQMFSSTQLYVNGRNHSWMGTQWILARRMSFEGDFHTGQAVVPFIAAFPMHEDCTSSFRLPNQRNWGDNGANMWAHFLRKPLTKHASGLQAT